MKENEPKAPFEDLSEKEIGERLRAFDAAKRNAFASGAEYRSGIFATPEVSGDRRIAQLQLPEGTTGIGLTFSSKTGGDVLELTNGTWLELDKNGIPTNPVVRERYELGEFPYTLEEKR